MSDTPRTDAHIANQVITCVQLGDQNIEVVNADFARQLERELTFSKMSDEAHQASAGEAWGQVLRFRKGLEVA